MDQAKFEKLTRNYQLQKVAIGSKTKKEVVSSKERKKTKVFSEAMNSLLYPNSTKLSLKLSQGPYQQDVLKAFNSFADSQRSKRASDYPFDNHHKKKYREMSFGDKKNSYNMNRASFALPQSTLIHSRESKGSMMLYKSGTPNESKASLVSAKRFKSQRSNRINKFRIISPTPVENTQHQKGVQRYSLTREGDRLMIDTKEVSPDSQGVRSKRDNVIKMINRKSSKISANKAKLQNSKFCESNKSLKQSYCSVSPRVKTWSRRDYCRRAFRDKKWVNENTVTSPPNSSEFTHKAPQSQLDSKLKYITEVHSEGGKKPIEYNTVGSTRRVKLSSNSIVDKWKQGRGWTKLIPGKNPSNFYFLFALVDEYDKKLLRDGKSEAVQESVQGYLKTIKKKKARRARRIKRKL
ncbi:unnamed protein product [Moneuplotes crassus]|uniref:Uncharacterized protein n=1 Tax=Euplotes crassus TaxID=5936 RepID=A0AAD1X665_EUPCR|nr:unnamed protein product [Moneuplotes crassus]